MKSIIGLGFALSVLGATSAIAAPHAASPVVATAKVSQPATLNVNTVGVDHKESQAANSTSLKTALNSVRSISAIDQRLCAD